MTPQDQIVWLRTLIRQIPDPLPRPALYLGDHGYPEVRWRDGDCYLLLDPMGGIDLALETRDRPTMASAGVVLALLATGRHGQGRMFSIGSESGGVG